MKSNKKEITTLEVDQSELDILIRGVRQRLSGWAEIRISDYKDRMSDDTGPQHYITGYQEYSRFTKEFDDEIKVLESLMGQWNINMINSGNSSNDFIRAKDNWIREFSSIQKDYDDGKFNNRK